jgi:hypothetical protein
VLARLCCTAVLSVHMSVAAAAAATATSQARATYLPGYIHVSARDQLNPDPRQRDLSTLHTRLDNC